MEEVGHCDYNDDMAKTPDKEEHILEIKKREQNRTVEELMAKSTPNSVYYTLLIISSFIIVSGLLLDNSAIVIGGMLLTPVLSPVLVIGLGLAIGELRSIKRPTILLIKSLLVIIVSALVLSLVTGIESVPQAFDNTIQTAVLYFVVAIASGIAGTFAWARKEVFDVLPGVAIAVSLVPPLSLVGIGISLLSVTLMRFYFSIFFFNLLGIIIGSVIAFSLLKFRKSEDKLKKTAEQLEHKIEKEEKAKAKEKASGKA